MIGPRRRRDPPEITLKVPFHAASRATDGSCPGRFVAECSPDLLTARARPSLAQSDQFPLDHIKRIRGATAGRRDCIFDDRP